MSSIQEPRLPRPTRKSKAYNLRAPAETSLIMLIDRVGGIITTFEVVNKVHREVPDDPELLDNQIVAARLVGTLVLERVHTNQHHLMPLMDYTDQRGKLNRRVKRWREVAR